jgi:diguanylate cyclase (GGDEF)-like protein
MEGLSGIEVCSRLRQAVKEPYIYMMLLTSTSHKDELIEGLSAGADDYVIKPFDGYELRARLVVARRFLDLQDRLIAMREEMRNQAMHDALTGLLNRTAMIEALNRELQRSEREGKPVGVVMADLDHFKRVNDDHGHLAGDAVLREASRRMLSVIRTYDFIGRYGGEEFMIVFPGSNREGVFRLAERLRNSVRNEPIDIQGGSLPVSMSLGAGSFIGCGYHDPSTVLRIVDEALYRAKRGGRNRTELTSPDEASTLAAGSAKAP